MSRRIEDVSNDPVAAKIIEFRDLDFESAKNEVSGYFRRRGEAYASDASTDLLIEYDLVCRIMDVLEEEGKLEPVK